MTWWFYLWLGVVAFSIILEFITADLVSIWFAGGGLVGMVFDAFSVAYYVQIPVFVVTVALLLFLCRKPIIKLMKKEDFKSNAQSVIGKEVTLLSDVSFEKAGSVKINGVVWSAVGQKDSDVIEQGKIVIITEIKGNKLIVKEKDYE